MTDGGRTTPALRFWMPLMFEPVDQFVELARSAEGLGFEGLALADHVAVPERFASVHPSGENPFTPESEFTEPLVVAASLAGATERLRFMSYVYVLGMREPLSVAKQVATLTAMHPGRFSFGVGAGWLTEEFEALGVDPTRRGRRLDECLEVLRQAWDTGWVDHHGELLDIDRVASFPVPASPPPILVGGASDAALRRAVRHDGWLGMNHDPAEIERLLRRLAELREEAGDDRADFEVFVIPNAAPSRQLLDDLAGAGVSATMVVPWVPGDPSGRDLAGKVEAMTSLSGALGLT